MPRTKQIHPRNLRGSCSFAQAGVQWCSCSSLQPQTSGDKLRLFPSLP
ncbi:HIVEP1 isoform 9 [Pan troglodytes]|uniref:HIVEP zinc finger 1 n=3 Tax=Pan TaxID=9596 RepID=A0A2I3RJW9_PANTR|nr:HIVEP1 isoform 9 [Pan troglodytes]